MIMSLLTDIKNVSDSAIEQLAARFGDLPKPLLAAIGAGDLAAERLAQLREQVSEKLGAAGGVPSGDDVKAFASDLPAKARKVAGDVAHQLEQLAAEVPGKAQKLVGELPAKAQEFTNSLSPENLRSTVEAYTRFVAMVYGNLAERGGETVAKARPEHGESGAPEAGKEATGADDAIPGEAPAAKAAPKPAAKKPAASAKPAAKAAGKPGAKPAGE
ncbi:MAG: hypothetical protein BGO26_12750 [Actinobacteria bacterium 69-20]|nr:MAG: hypothetical protein BGO26_12750 [Actinobacteria bacterium 69-20]